MASPKLELRVSPALMEAIDAAASESGRTRSAEAQATLEARYLGIGEPPVPEPAPAATPAPRKPKAAEPAAPKVEAARDALAQVEARVGVKPAAMAGAGVNMAAAFDRAGVETFGKKRLPYQKGEAGAGKGKRR